MATGVEVTSYGGGLVLCRFFLLAPRGTKGRKKDRRKMTECFFFVIVPDFCPLKNIICALHHRYDFTGYAGRGAPPAVSKCAIFAIFNGTPREATLFLSVGAVSYSRAIVIAPHLTTRTSCRP